MTNRLLAQLFAPHGVRRVVKCRDPRFIKASVRIDTSGQVTIGPETIISHEVLIYTHEHYHAEQKATHLEQQQDLGVKISDLWIGPDVYIGARAVITERCNKIGKGAVIGALSLVNKDVPPYEIWGGVPAKCIGYRPQWYDQEEKDGWR